MINRVRYRGGRARYPNLAHAARTDRVESEIRFADKINFDRRRIGVHGHVIVGEVRRRRQTSLRDRMQSLP